MSKGEWVYGAGTWIGFVVMLSADEPKSMVIGCAIAMASWLLYLSARQDEVNRKMQDSIDRIWKRLNPQMYQDDD